MLPPTREDLTCHSARRQHLFVCISATLLVPRAAVPQLPQGEPRTSPNKEPPKVIAMRNLVLPLFLFSIGISTAFGLAPSLSIGASQSCPIDVPACGSGCGACTTIVKAEEVAPIPDLCGGGNLIKITVTSTCGTATCSRSGLVCLGSTAPAVFCCNGCQYQVALPGTKNWGEYANGSVKCADMTGTCIGQCP